MTAKIPRIQRRVPIKGTKKTKDDPDFFFKNLSKEEMIDSLDDEFPVSLKNQEELVSRLHDKYPIITKIEVALILKEILITIRKVFFFGDKLNVQYILNNFRINFNLRKNPVSDPESSSKWRKGIISKSIDTLYILGKGKLSTFFKKEIKEYDAGSE